MVPSRRSWRCFASRFRRRESVASFVFFKRRLALFLSRSGWSFCTIRVYPLGGLETPKDSRPLKRFPSLKPQMRLPSLPLHLRCLNTFCNQQPSVPGALFEDKPHFANDSWRKFHSDPLHMIRPREHEALARIKNNLIKMAMIRMIRESVEGTEHKEKDRDKKESRKKHHHSSSKHHKHNRDSRPIQMMMLLKGEKERWLLEVPQITINKITKPNKIWSMN